MNRVILIFVFLSANVLSQDSSSVRYGLKTGVTFSAALRYSEENDPSDARFTDSRVGMNVGFFIRPSRNLLLDLSIVQKGFKNVYKPNREIREPLTYLSLGCYLTLPSKLYPFGGIHVDHLLSENSSSRGPLTKDNWSFSLGLGYDNLEIFNRHWLTELKLDFLDQKNISQSGGHKHISLDLKCGLYLNH